MLEQGDISTQQQGRQTGHADNQEPELGTGQDRIHTGHQKDTGFYHGRGVQISTDRRRRRHGMRQPEMERELGRFGKRTQQYQHQNYRIGCMLADQITAGQHIVQAETAYHMADQQYAGQKGQTTGAGNSQCHTGTFTRFCLVPPETDQQEGADTGQFPEHPQLNQVVGHHHAEHGKHKENQIGVKLAHRILFRQVITGV